MNAGLLLGFGRRAVVSIALIALAVGSTHAATLDKIREAGTIRIAYRTDAPPFAFKDTKGEPAGLIIELCRVVAAKIAADVGIKDIKIAYVSVTAEDRFQAVTNGGADLLCDPTSVTLTRRAQVDFSIATFVDGAGMMIRDDGPREFSGLAGKQVGVLAGTTTEKSLSASLAASNIKATVVPVRTHEEGIAQLDGGKIAAYFADRSILMFLAGQSDAPKRLRLGDKYLSVEPYALALPRGDNEFRLAVDRALSRVYRSGEINTIYKRVFRGAFEPTDILKTLYLVSGLPE